MSRLPFLLLFFLAANSQAALILSVSDYTSDVLSFTINGTFDQDTIGSSAGFLAIKNDWENNRGVHTELWSALPTITENTISIAGLAAPVTIQNDRSSWQDAIFWANPLSGTTGSAIEAGTSVSGSVTLLAVGAFNPASIASLQLLSGFYQPSEIPGVRGDWARLEASATSAPIPAPAPIWLFGAALAGLAWFRQKQAV